MDKKTFNKQNKLGCKVAVVFAGKKNLSQNECEKIKMCKWDNCQQEIIARNAAELTEKETASCSNKDIKKMLACEKRISDKKGLHDKLANEIHCEVTKCPQMRTLQEKITNSYTQQLNERKKKLSVKSKANKMTPYEIRIACIDSKCSKEKEHERQLYKAFNAKAYECQAKYKTWKEQSKCSNSENKKYNAAIKKTFKCSTKHCPKQSISNINSKKN